MKYDNPHKIGSKDWAIYRYKDALVQVEYYKKKLNAAQRSFTQIKETVFLLESNYPFLKNPDSTEETGNMFNKG